MSASAAAAAAGREKGSKTQRQGLSDETKKEKWQRASSSRMLSKYLSLIMEKAKGLQKIEGGELKKG